MSSEPDGVWLAETPVITEPEATMTLPHPMLTHSSATELYDSGVSQHFSPFYNQFVRFKSIPPKSISTADKHMFQAIGQGDLHVKVPNRDMTMQILLKDILYVPSMGVTLVLTSKLAVAGYSALFCGSVCDIFNPHKKLVGVVFKSPVADC